MKRLFIFLLAVSFPLVFTACGKEKGENIKGSINGTWKYSRVSVNTKGGMPILGDVIQEFIRNYAEQNLPELITNTTVTFKADGTGVVKGDDGQVPFAYTLINNELDVDGGQFTYSFHVSSITQSQMTWSEDVTDMANEQLGAVPGFIAFSKVTANIHLDRQ